MAKKEYPKALYSEDGAQSITVTGVTEHKEARLAGWDVHPSRRPDPLLVGADPYPPVTVEEEDVTLEEVPEEEVPEEEKTEEEIKPPSRGPGRPRKS
jgi:hypothetical protein